MAMTTVMIVDQVVEINERKKDLLSTVRGSIARTEMFQMESRRQIGFLRLVCVLETFVILGLDLTRTKPNL